MTDVQQQQQQQQEQSNRKIEDDAYLMTLVDTDALLPSNVETFTGLFEDTEGYNFLMAESENSHNYNCNCDHELNAEELNGKFNFSWLYTKNLLG